MTRLPDLFITALISIVTILSYTSDSHAGRKAIVMGVGNYLNVTPLDGPLYDAKSVFDELVTLGFNATLLSDNDVSTQKYPIRWGEFLDSLQPNDDVVIYYSGHGVEIGGANYIVPQDVLSPDQFPNDIALAKSLISIKAMTNDLVGKQARAIIWIIDACRDNPFASQGKALGGKGLAAEPSPVGTFIFYAAGFGETALARTVASGRNSLYTSELLAAMKTMASKPAYQIAVAIRQTVRDKAHPHRQRPAYYDGLDGSWCFVDCDQQEVQISLNTKTDVIDVKSLNNVSDLRESASSLAPGKLAALHDERTGNAVFIGRSSFSDTCSTNEPDDRAPFGCDFLKRVASGDLKSAVGQKVNSVTEVNVRRGAPLLSIDGTFSSQCRVAVLSPREPVTFSSITALEQGADKFFWGTLEGPARDCDGAVMDDASGRAPITQGVSDPTLATIVDQLNADATLTRRNAREKLAKFVETADDQILEQLTDTINEKSYRYQLGVAVALAESKKALPERVQKELDALLSESKDSTLKNVLGKIQPSVEGGQ